MVDDSVNEPTVADCSFMQFVYPFVVDDTFLEKFTSWNQTFDKWADRLSSSRYKNLVVWSRNSFNPTGLLSHIRDYLNPTDDRHPTALLWSLDGNFLQSPHGLGGGNNRDVSWFLRVPNKSADGEKHRQLEFQISGIKLSLFETGVGLLTIQVSPHSRNLGDWFDFIHYFRFAAGRRDVRVKARSDSAIIGRKKISAEPDRPFFPEYAGGLEQHPEGQGTFGELIQSLLNLSGPTPDAIDWWRDVHVPGKFFPYVGLFIDNVQPKDEPELAYRARRFFHQDQQLALAPGDISATNDSRVWRYADRQWFNFSLDGPSFIAFDSPDTPFFRQTLPDHIQSQYFLLMQLAWQQRATLLTLAHLLAETWYSQKQNNETEKDYELRRTLALGQMQDLLISFMARGHFTHAAPEENHHTAYSKWYDVLEVDQLFKGVSQQMSHLHEHIHRRKTEELTQNAAANLKEVVHVQRAVHLLELVIFPIYIVELWFHLRNMGHSHEHENNSHQVPPEPCGILSIIAERFNVELLGVFALAFAVTFVVVEWSWVKKKLGCGRPNKDT